MGLVNMMETPQLLWLSKLGACLFRACSQKLNKISRATGPLKAEIPPIDIVCHDHLWMI